MLSMMNKTQSYLNFSKSSRDLAKRAADIVQGLTGFERVMVYEFDEEWNGRVISESRNGPNTDSFLGLHFPHTDIPKQARELYVLNKVPNIL